MASLYVTNTFTGKGVNGVNIKLTGSTPSDIISGVTKNDMLAGEYRDGVFLFTFPSTNRSYLVSWSGGGTIAGSQQMTLTDSNGIGVQINSLPLIPIAIGGSILAYVLLVRK